MNTKTSENFLRTMRILYIESDELFSKEVTKALSIKSKYIYNACGVDEAKYLLEKISFDIIITEINLKDGDGLDLIRYIKGNYEKIQIIVLSSILDTNILLESIKLNLIDYIPKPINISKLREALKVASIKIFKSGSFEVSFCNGTKYNYRKKLLRNSNGDNIKITHNESSLLDVLILNQHCILSMETLKTLVWEDAYEVSDIAFKSLLSRLRTKIGKQSVKNISGSGYSLEIKK